MPIPDYESLMLPLLEIASRANGEEVKLSIAADQLARRFKLTDKERTELLPSGGTNKAPRPTGRGINRALEHNCLRPKGRGIEPEKIQITRPIRR